MSQSNIPALTPTTAAIAAGLVAAGAVAASLLSGSKTHPCPSKMAMETPAPMMSATTTCSKSNVKHMRGSQNPHILGIGTANPGQQIKSSDIAEMMSAALQLEGKDHQRLMRIAENSTVDVRHTVFDDGKEVFWGRSKPGDNATLDERNTRYKKEAPGLAHAAAERAIKDWGGNKKDITHVVAISCTGIMTPGLEFHLVQSLGLQPDTQRLSILMMGCFGGSSALKQASALAAQDPKHRVLAVCCELCSLHFQMDRRTDNLVGGSLFADGASAIIMGQPTPSEKPLYEFLDCSSFIIPETLDLMAWNMTGTGWELGLSPQIPAQILKHVGGFVDELKKKAGIPHVKNEDCMWPVHPGGRSIIEAIEEACGLDKNYHTAATREVLRTKGNMSSGTILFCMDKTRQMKPEKDYAISVSFGPGLNVEGTALRICERAKMGM